MKEMSLRLSFSPEYLAARCDADTRSIRCRIFCSMDCRFTHAKMLRPICSSGASTQKASDLYFDAIRLNLVARDLEDSVLVLRGGKGWRPATYQQTRITGTGQPFERQRAKEWSIHRLPWPGVSFPRLGVRVSARVYSRQFRCHRVPVGH